MYYYIIDNKITEFKDELDNDLYNHQKLTHEQGLFYREYPNASIDEILDMELNPVYEPTLEVLKSQRIDMFSRMAFDIRNTIYPDYKLINAGLGLYHQILPVTIQLMKSQVHLYDRLLQIVFRSSLLRRNN